jgi:hypothetical protein
VPPSRRWLRFSLRTLLIAITLFGIWLGLRVNAARRQAQAVAEIRKQRSGSVYYDFELQANNPAEAKSWVPSWIIARTGPDLFHNVVSAHMTHLDASNWWEIDDLHTRKPWNKLQVVADVRRHLAALPRLRRLDLWVWPEVSEQCLAAVGELSNLEGLVCEYATDAGVAHLASQRRLKSVHMDNSKLTDDSLRVFGTLPLLEHLQATRNHFTDDGLAHLHHLKRLISLDIDCGETRFTDAGLVHLEGLQSLQMIFLQNTLVTPVGVARLQRAIPSLRDVLVTPPPPYLIRPSDPDPFAPQ